MPPLAGPRLMLCWTRYPVKIRVCPLSSLTGKWHVNSRCTSRKTSRSQGSSLISSAASSNCDWAVLHSSASMTGFNALAVTSVSECGGQSPLMRQLSEAQLAPPLCFDDGLELCGAHISTDDRGYSASGSQITLMHAGSPDLNARSSAGRISDGRSTNSPYPPSASTTLS